MFLDRLKIVGKSILYWVSMFLITIIMFSGLLFLLVKFSFIELLAKILIGIVFIVIVVCVLFGLISKIVQFIYWLFVEPYKNRKNKSNDKYNGDE